jgi:hypothetical protein
MSPEARDAPAPEDVAPLRHVMASLVSRRNGQ